MTGASRSRAGAGRAVALAAALALVAGLATGCASAPREEPGRTAERDPDRTDDPEFLAALEAADREFPTQADALAAGVYEPFVHPDSITPAPATGEDLAAGPEVAAPTGRGERPWPGTPEDPTTEELLGTLPGEPAYNPPAEPAGPAPATPAAIDRGAAKTWTIQAGAFATETGALVRIRQLERDAPDLPRWYAADRGLYRVYVGRFADRAEAEARVESLATKGYVDAWVTPIP